jgi:hypothetical protein
MISSRILAKNIVPTLNAKGADAFESTTNPALDLFTYTSKNFSSDANEFSSLVSKIVEVKNYNSELFFKLLKFPRLIEKGNGIKNIYYLGMLLLKQEDPETYSKILEWSYEYPKDILTLARLCSMYQPIGDTNPNATFDYQSSYVSGTAGSKGKKMSYVESKYHDHDLIDSTNNKITVPCEIRIYGDLVLDTFKKLISGSKDYNPMLLKYMGYETGHWAIESEFIWSYLDSRLKNDSEFVELLDSTEPIHGLGLELRTYLKNNRHASGWFTNKNRRKIKKIFNSYVNLTDHLFKGIHSDGTQFGSHASRDEEVELIYNQLKRTPTISLNNFTKTIKKFASDEAPLSLRNQLLVDGYARYVKALTRKEAVAKVRGLDITSKCWTFFRDEVDTDAELEAQLGEAVNQIRQYLQSSFNEEFTFEDFANSLIPVLDISGSMSGVPIETGLYYFLIMVKIFGTKELYYFESVAHKLTLTQEEIDGPICALIKKIYTPVSGSTNLKAVFDMLEEDSKSNKTVMIITDSDCDPNRGPRNGSSNPFHQATTPGNGYSHLPSNNYVVVNVKLEKLNFPFIDIDPKVCYVTGNNPKTLNGLIKSIIISKRDNISITPELILTNSLQMDELNLPDIQLRPYSKVFTQSEINNIFKVIQKNLPPKPVSGVTIGDLADADSSDDSDVDDE